jgi:hypothetical protein
MGSREMTPSNQPSSRGETSRGELGLLYSGETSQGELGLLYSGETSQGELGLLYSDDEWGVE